MIICVCKGISDRQVKEAIAEGSCTFEELSQAVDGAGTICGICQGMLRVMLDDHSPAGQMVERGGRHAKRKQEDR